MADFKAMAYKASILLELIDQLQQGPVSLDSFCDNFNLSSQQKHKYLQTLRDMELDLYTGERYRKTTNIYLLSARNIKEAIEVLESKVKMTKISYKKAAVNKNPNLSGSDRFSEKNISEVITVLNGSDKPRKQILSDLEKALKPKTFEEKFLIIKTYELWRSNYMKCEV